MTPKEYLIWIQRVISESLIIVSSDIHFEEISSKICYIKGKLEFIDKSALYFIEYVVLGKEAFREKYKYHWQDENKKQISRWDNVKHHRHIETFPHHYHDAANKPLPSNIMDLEKVLIEIEKRGLLSKI